MATTSDPGEIGRKTQADRDKASAAYSNAADPWEAPRPFGMGELPAFPVGRLPAVLGQMCQEVSKALQVPVEIPVFFGIAAVGVTVQGRLQARLNAGWTEALCLWLIALAESGIGKGPVFSAMVAPIQEMEARGIAWARAQRAQNQAAFNAAKMAIERHEKRASTQGPVERAATLALAETERQGLPAMPPDPQLFSDDCTPEALVDVLARNGGCASFFSSESASLETMMGRYSENSKPNLNVYLSGYSGEFCKVNRKKNDSAPVYVPRTSLTFGLAVQPEAALDMIQSGASMKRGLLARFLYAVSPSLVGTRDWSNPEVIDAQVSARYRDGLRRLATLPRHLDELECLVPADLTFSPEAYRAVLDFKQWVEPQMGRDGELGLNTEWLSKLPGQCARIASLLHLLHVATTWTIPEGQPPFWAYPVDVYWANAAVAICRDFLMPHAWAAQFTMGRMKGAPEAMHVLRWIRGGQALFFTQKQALDALQGTFPNVDELKRPLDALEARHYIRRVADTKPGVGRKKAIYQVNPATHQAA